jgi:hypothetical protein
MSRKVREAIPKEARDAIPLPYGVVLGKKKSEAWRSPKAKAKTPKHLIT